MAQRYFGTADDTLEDSTGRRAKLRKVWTYTDAAKTSPFSAWFADEALTVPTVPTSDALGYIPACFCADATPALWGGGASQTGAEPDYVAPLIRRDSTDDVSASLTALDSRVATVETVLPDLAPVADVSALDTRLGTVETALPNKAEASQLSATVRVVAHGTTATTARPADVDIVLWVGTVDPTGATADDLLLRSDTSSLSRYDGAAWDALGGPGGTSLSVQDENGTALTGISLVDFQGAGVTVTEGAAGEVVVTVPGGSGSITPTATQNALTGWWHVDGYGALGDGTTNDHAAIQAAVDACALAGGGVVYFPPTPNGYLTLSTTLVPGGVLLTGSSMDYATSPARPSRGSVLFTTAAIAAVVQLGDDNMTSASGETGASMERLIVDGGGVATAVVRTAGRRNYIRHCQIWRGASVGVLMDGQNGYLTDSVIGQNNVGDCVRITFYDNKVKRNQIRQSGAAQVRVMGAAGGIEITDNHMFGGADGTLVGTTGTNITVENDCNSILINNNVLDGTNGSQIYLAPTSGVMGSATIVGNVCYQITGFPDGTLPAIKLQPAAAATVRAVTIVGNTFSKKGTGGRYKAMVEKAGTGTVEMVALVANVGDNCNAIASGLTPTADIGNSIRSTGGVITTSASATAIAVQEDGVEEAASITALNVSTGLSVAVAGGVATLTADGGGAATLAVQEDGVEESAAVGTLNVSTGLSVAVAGGVATLTADGGGGAGPITKLKPVAESVTSSATLQDDDDLSFAAAASTTYIIDAVLMVFASIDSPDIKVALTLPTGASMRVVVEGVLLSETAVPAATRILGVLTASGTAVAAGAVASLTVPVRLSGTVTLGTTAGDVQVQWAQNSANPSATQVLNGSYLRAQAVA